MKHRLTRLSTIVAFFTAAANYALAFDPKKEDEAFNVRLLASIQADDYAAFVADGTEAFRALPKPQFESVASQLTPKLNQPHNVVFLGELNQRGYRVTLWKIVFLNGSDDALISLSVKDGKVGGYWIK